MGKVEQVLADAFGNPPSAETKQKLDMVRNTMRSIYPLEMTLLESSYAASSKLHLTEASEMSKKVHDFVASLITEKSTQAAPTSEEMELHFLENFQELALWHVIIFHIEGERAQEKLEERRKPNDRRFKEKSRHN